MTTAAKPPALIGGPHELPRNAHIGVAHDCEVRGELVVTGFTDAPIPWIRGRPHKGKGPPTLIVCGDLARAVREESARAVAHWWGVTSRTVTTWRKSLGVGPITPGSSAAWAANVPEPPTSKEAVERGRAGARKRWGNHKAKRKGKAK